jgi:hypothetical protein
MPRAKDNRKPVGTGPCEQCGDNTGEYFQVQSGKKMGYLYRKCLNCPANQSKTPADQFAWLAAMSRTPYPMIPHPLQVQGPVHVPEAPAPVQDVPATETATKTVPVPNRAGFIGVAAMAGAVALALFT